MSVVFMRAGNPAPGKQIDALQFTKARAAAADAAYGTKTTVYTRLGGPTGQIVTVTHFANMSELEEVKARIVKDAVAGKLKQQPEGLFAELQDAIWAPA
ncbi:MAG: hypothetical protein KGN16_26025 [Burkholderiales bacterium]|nr:hypothetical protein [Burkholderiales bacterium]